MTTSKATGPFDQEFQGLMQDLFASTDTEQSTEAEIAEAAALKEMLSDDWFQTMLQEAQTFAQPFSASPESSMALCSDWELAVELEQSANLASKAIEELSNRAIGHQQLELLQKIEVSFAEASISIERMQQVLKPQHAKTPRRSWLKFILLHEFHFINRWLR